MSDAKRKSSSSDFKEKYKEEKLAHRKNHTRKILEQQERGRRAFLIKESEFVGTLKFRNSLPDIPFDPKFLKYPHEPNRFVKYRPTSIESDYVYQLHTEPHLGLPIDLIDLRKYEVPSTQPELPEADEHLLSMKDDIASKDKGRQKVRPNVTWLRRTEYMGNDLYDAVHQFESEINFNQKRQEKLQSQVEEPTTVAEKAEKSFKDLVQDDSQLSHPTKKNLKPAKVWKVLPDEKLYASSLALLTYDMLPQNDMEGADCTERQNRAILRNVDSTEMKGGLTAMVGSLVVPSTIDVDDSPEQEKFDYFRDYQMDLKTINDQYIMYVDPNSDTVSYCEVSARVTLKKTKMGGTDDRRRGALVKRRKLTPSEETEMQKRLYKIGIGTKPVEDAVPQSPEGSNSSSSENINDSSDDDSD